MHAQSCKSHCHGGVKVVLGGWVGLLRCARGKCIQRVANRIVMVVSRWVCGAVLGGNAFRELQIALSELQIALESERKKRFQ